MGTAVRWPGPPRRCGPDPRKLAADPSLRPRPARGPWDPEEAGDRVRTQLSSQTAQTPATAPMRLPGDPRPGVAPLSSGPGGRETWPPPLRPVWGSRSPGLGGSPHPGAPRRTCRNRGVVAGASPPCCPAQAFVAGGKLSPAYSEGKCSFL